MVGIVGDVAQACGQAWQNTGDLIYLLGVVTTANPSPQVTLGGSEYLATLHQTIAGQPPVVDFDLERRVQAVCRHGVQQGWINSAHDCSEGGLAVAIAESAIWLHQRSANAGKTGASINLGEVTQRWDNTLFGEGGARIIVSITPSYQADFEAYLNQHLANNWQHLGTVGNAGGNIQISSSQGEIINVSVADITNTWANAIERRLALD
jgi:phosphoribosylformylglycinamidine synthase